MMCCGRKHGLDVTAMQWTGSELCIAVFAENGASRQMKPASMAAAIDECVDVDSEVDYGRELRKWSAGVSER
jgi:hypothetical protein